MQIVVVAIASVNFQIFLSKLDAILNCFVHPTAMTAYVAPFVSTTRPKVVPKDSVSSMSVLSILILLFAFIQLVLITLISLLLTMRLSFFLALLQLDGKM